jgi:hypothetical protein
MDGFKVKCQRQRFYPWSESKVSNWLWLLPFPALQKVKPRLHQACIKYDVNWFMRKTTSFNIFFTFEGGIGVTRSLPWQQAWQ